MHLAHTNQRGFLLGYFWQDKTVCNTQVQVTCKKNKPFEKNVLAKNRKTLKWTPLGNGKLTVNKVKKAQYRKMIRIL